MKQTAITKSQKRLFILLVIIASYAVYDFATAKPKPAKFVSDASSQTNAVKTELASAVTGSTSQSDIQISFPISEWRRDPFRKQAEKIIPINFSKDLESIFVPKTGNLNLTAISKNGTKSYALINDQILTVSESIHGFKIIDIQANRVVLKKNDYSFTLTLPEDE